MRFFYDGEGGIDILSSRSLRCTRSVCNQRYLRAGGRVREKEVDDMRVRRRWALATLILPTLLVSIDMTILYMALPEITVDLAPSATQLLWITDIYGFLLAGMLLTMGTLGDRIGRRRLLLLGCLCFGVASVLVAFATSPAMLIATRALLGIAGATIMPSSLALITTMYPDERERGTAIAVWMVAYSAGMAVGPLLGGALLEAFWWGSVFLVNVPVVAAVLLAGPALLPEYRAQESGRLDLLSVLLSLGAVLPIVYGVKTLAVDGAFDIWTTVALVSGLVLGAAFVRRQRNRSDAVLDLRLFRAPAFGSAVAVLLLVLIVFGGVYLLFTQYLQLSRGLSPWAAGLWMLPSVVAVAAGNLLGPITARRLGMVTVGVAGLAVSLVGAVLLTVNAGAGLHVVAVACTLIMFGVSPMMVLGIDLIVGSAPPERAGSAAAVSETSGELGFALGVAVLGSVSAAAYRAALPAELSTGVSAQGLAGAASGAVRFDPGTAERMLAAARSAYDIGLQVVGGVVVLLVVVSAALSIALLRRPAPAAPVAPAADSDAADQQLRADAARGSHDRDPAEEAR